MRGEDKNEQPVQINKDVLRRMQKAGGDHKPRLFGKQVVEMACIDWLKKWDAQNEKV